MTKNQRIFVFDAYGTLFKINSSNLGLSVNQQKIADKVQALWRIRQVEYTWLISQMGNWIDFNQITSNALDFALETYEVNDHKLRKVLMDVYKTPTIFEDVIPFLKTAKKQGITTAILSNGVKDQLIGSTESNNINQYIDDYFSAGDVKIYKPSKKVYQLVIDKFKASPKEIVFFSSNSWDVNGAASFGFNTIWVNRNQTVFEKLGFQPNLMIDSLMKYAISN